MSIQKINRKSRPFLLRFKDIDGNYISMTFATRSQAEEYQKAHSAEKKLPPDLRLSGPERAELLRIKSLCEQSGHKLSEAVAIIEKFFYHKKFDSLPVDVAVRKYFQYIELRKVRHDTARNYYDHVNRFARWFKENFSVDDLSRFLKEHAQAYIDQANSKEHVVGALRAMWSFLLANNLVHENVFKGLKIVKILKDKPPIPVMSVIATDENIHAIRDEFKPLYALLTFAGIRPQEIIPDPQNTKKELLKFEDIDFVNKRITIRAEVAKTRKPRIIYDLPPNIWLWLEPLKQTKEIFPDKIKAWRKNQKEFITDKVYNQWRVSKEKLPHKIPHDALRHSFASYAYHILGVEHAVEALGHDYQTYKNFYKGLATIKDSQDYFNIVP